MLRRGRGRPRKQVSCSVATLTSSRKVQLKKIGKVIYRKQLNLRRQRILELATANFCSTITGNRSSLRDLKHFARQLGKRAEPAVYPFCQQRASGVLEDRKSSPQCEHDHVDLNSSESGDTASGTAIFEDILWSKEDESPFDAFVDQWVGVEILLFGRKSSIGEVGSTTSNVCDKLRSVVADPEREDVYASSAKRRDDEEGREWSSAKEDGIVPSWVSCRRSITRNRRINASGGISDCHISALLASLPKTGSHIDGKATTTNSISLTEENGLHPCADEGAVIPVDLSSAAVIPIEQSFASQESIVNSSDLHPCADEGAVITVDLSSAVVITTVQSLAAVIPIEQSFAPQESNVNSSKGSSLDFGEEKQTNISVLQRDSIQVCPTTPEKAQKRRRNYHDSIPNHDVKDMEDCEPSSGKVLPIDNLDLGPSAGDNSVKESGDGLFVMETLSPYSVDFESSCNLTEVGKRGLSVAGVECARSLVDSIPTPATADPLGSISHVASIIIDLVQENSQLFQTHVPSAPVLVAESISRKEKRAKSKLDKNSGRIAKTLKVRKKYQPKVAKVKKTSKCCARRLKNKCDGNTRNHGVSKHARTEVICHQIIRGDMQRGTSARDSCISHNTLCENHEQEYPGIIEEGRNLFHHEEIMGSKIDDLVSKPVTSVSPTETPLSIDNTCLTRSDLEGPNPHEPFNLEHDRTASDSLLYSTCGLKRRITSDTFETGQTEQANNLFSPSEEEMISNSFIERQKHSEALSVALSNRVLILLDLPSIGQPHSLYTTAGEVERSPSISSCDVSLYYNTEVALKEYPQATDEDGFPLFSEEWTAYHVGSAEMTALNAFNVEEMSFDMFYKEQQSAVPEDTLFQTLTAELNEYYTAIADTWVGGSPFIEDHCGGHNLSSNSQCRLDEFCFMHPNSCPRPVQRSLLAQMVSPEPIEDRTMSSFFASTSAGLNNIMFSRLNEMIKENVQKDAFWNENAEQDLDMDVRPYCGQAEDLDMDVRPDCGQAEHLDIDVRPDCGQTEAPSTCSVQPSSEGFKGMGLLGDYSCEEEDLMEMRNAVICQMCSPFQNLDTDPDSAFPAESDVVSAEDNLEIIGNNSVPCQFSFQSQDAEPDANFAGESATEVNNALEDGSHDDILSIDNATLNQTCPQKDVCSAETPFHLMTFDQLVAFMEIILVSSSEMCPLTLLRHVQDHLPEEEKVEFEKLWPMILHPVDNEELLKLIDQAEIDLPQCMELVQYYQQITGQDDGAKEDNLLVPCMEVIEYQQIERRDDGQDDASKEDNHLAPCMEVIEYQQIERRDDGQDDASKEDNHLAPCMEVIEYQQIERRDDVAKEDNRVTDLVPYVGNNAIVAYDGSFFPPPKRKPRPKVNLDTETIRVWKLLMGKTETTENNPDEDNELKWKQERRIMQEQAETFIRRMHLIQGDRSFSRWKGSIVDSVIGVFLAQNVSDVLSSSAFMCLRARFPRGKGSRGPPQSNSPEGHVEEMFQNDVQVSPGSFQTFQEPLTSCSHEVSFNCASATLANESREEILNPQELQREENLSTSIPMQKEVLTGPERARLEAEHVRARKSAKWDAMAEKYNARCKQAAMDMDAAPPRTEMTQDGVDWEAVRCADLEEIADAIKERGMNWKLAGRIKGFLERLRMEQGGLDLEWLRSIPSDDAKQDFFWEFLTSVHGLGLKSVECIRLLTLHHLAFPVDTNVGRIVVRLGWVPLEPLPEELQLHVLELYPVQATIQKYLWPRLCTLDQQTLYELHYQLITFGKVFCTKSKPNCNACPMRPDCKHFASALSSAKLALPPSEGSSGSGATLALPPGSSFSAETGEGAPKTPQPSMCMSRYCQPIIEEPMTPESEADMSECDIEDYPFSIEEIAHETMMELVIQEIQGRQQMQLQLDNSNRCFQFNLSTALSDSEIVQEMDMETLAQPKVVSSTLDSAHTMEEEQLENDYIPIRDTTLFDDAPSREVVMLPPGAASIPVPKLKNIERLRTVHYVYELPDRHPLLEGMDVREPDDPCFYLLAIWSPGEVPESIPNINDDNEETGFTSSSDEESIKATLLVPCRTAMQGSFPLNGTYFQTNEVFADHKSSLQPILVPRVLLWNLRRRFVYFGTSVTSILRGMTTEEIQACFWRGYVCVRGFDCASRAPKPLVGRLHFQTTKSIMRSASAKNTKT